MRRLGDQPSGTKWRRASLTILAWPLLLSVAQAQEVSPGRVPPIQPANTQHIIAETVEPSNDATKPMSAESLRVSDHVVTPLNPIETQVAPPKTNPSPNDAPAKTAEPAKQEPKAIEVGSDLNMSAQWDNGLIFTTPNKDWKIHVGGRFQYEPVFWVQPGRLQGAAPGNGGIPDSAPNGGVGSLDDGMFMRRVRFRTDGTGYELMEFALEVNFEQLNFITYDHLWFGFKDLPFLGTVRFGQQKVPQGIENLGSDYHLTFLERTQTSEAFSTLFGQGVLIANTYFDQNVTFQTMFHRVQPTGFFTSDFGDGDYAETSRITWTPVYEADGRCVLHLGGSYQWRRGDLGRSIQPGGTGNTFADASHVVRFRARPEQRDATGIGTGVLGGDTARFVDTGFLLADDVHTFAPEFILIQGPFSLQAEGSIAYVENARSIYPTVGGATAVPNSIPRGRPMFWGGYVEASYFLTGENRGYDRRFGVYDRVKVRENFFMARGEDCRTHWGLGAWQVGYRISYLDLNDNGINGGQLVQSAVALNWHFNDNAKVQLQYLNANRNVAGPAVSGTVHGVGMLFQWYF